VNAPAEFNGQTLKLPPLGDMRLKARGAFEGYASLFGVEDQGRDVVMPGAFRASLDRRGTHDIRMLFQHDPAQPIGLWDDISEDARGLHVRGHLIEDVARARELLALMRAGALDGLSIGFRARRATRDARTGQRRLHEIDLWEISIVTFPMLPGARVNGVKGGATAACNSARPQMALAGSSKACSVRPSGAIGSRPAALSPARRETRPGGGFRLA
jgi:HK97 family phage prohead protease